MLLRPVMLCLLVIATGLIPRAASALEVGDEHWGFDGSVVNFAFNPLSFEVANSDVTPFEGEIRLEAVIGASRVDVVVVEPLFLSPQSRRRVQFFPFIMDVHTEWVLVWGRGPDNRRVLRTPPLGPPASVVLRDRDAVSMSRVGLKSFDESFFPFAVTGCRGLSAAVLDHVPDWQELQQQAFLDWLQLGGNVVLLGEVSGGQMTFASPLDVLNQPSDDFRVGAGHVIRRGRAEGMADARTLSEQFAARFAPSATAAAAESAADGTVGGFGYDTVNPHDVLLRTLKSLSKADHNWPLIYLMSLTYLFVIFPGCWLIGRWRSDYRITYGALIAAVCLFSMGFTAIGKRGYGEQTALHAAAAARPLPGGRLEVLQWTNFFVTEGGDYEITHPGEGLMYSSGQHLEAVKGVALNAPRGGLIVDIPPFSSRSIIHAGVAQGSPLRAAVVRFEADSQLRTLQLKLDGVPLDGSFIGYALFGSAVHPLSVREGLVQTTGHSFPFEQWLRPDSWEQSLSPGPGWGEPQDISPEAALRNATLPLAAAALGIHNRQMLAEFEVPNDRARLLVEGPLPEELFAEVETPQQVGRVVYVIDVPRPDAATMPNE